MQANAGLGKSSCRFELTPPLDELIRLAAVHKLTLQDIVAAALRVVVDRLDCAFNPASKDEAEPFEQTASNDAVMFCDLLRSDRPPPSHTQEGEGVSQVLGGQDKSPYRSHCCGCA